jgi:hypothetical protein
MIFRLAADEKQSCQYEKKVKTVMVNNSTNVNKTNVYAERKEGLVSHNNNTNTLFMCSNIPASPAYGVYISQLIRYARASSNYSDFLKRHLHLRNRLLDQGY